MPDLPPGRLSRADVVQAALDLLEAHGPAALTLHAVARALGVRAPSLYNHVESLGDLQQAMIVQVMRQVLAVPVPASSSQPSDALRALCEGFRALSRTRPSHVNWIITFPGDLGRAPLAEVWGQVLGRILGGVEGFPIPPEARIHASYLVISALAGFHRMELRGAIDPQDADASFAWMVDRLVETLEALGPRRAQPG